jgi:serine/threonine-protein phosphatase 2A activator
MANTGGRPRLALLPNTPRKFKVPRKEIDDGEKVEFWLKSKAHSDVMTFLLQLNIAMFPTTPAPLSNKLNVDPLPDIILGLQRIIAQCTDYIKDAPPDTAPRRFGNISFRHWYTLVETSTSLLLNENLPSSVKSFPTTEDSPATAMDELKKIFLGSFGSSERLDYGTGHELSFFAFLAGIWKLRGFENIGEDAERQIVLGVLLPYVV